LSALEKTALARRPHISAAVTGHFKTFVSFDAGSFQRVLAHAQKLAACRR
jgi:hypothetical protein